MAGPKDGWDKFDIVAKFTIGVFGLAATALIGWNQLDQVRRANDAKDFDGLRGVFLESYKFARADRGGDCAVFEESADQTRSFAIGLSGFPGFDQYNKMALQLRDPKCTDTPNTPAARKDEAASALRNGEAAASTVPIDATRWFTVIGSYKATPDGRRQANEDAARLARTLGCTEIWQTRISNNYAVVVGSGTTQGKALERASAARAAVPDAFTQVDRDWTRVGDACPAA